MQPFDGCRLRIKRANLHFKAAAATWNAVPSEDLYSFGSYVNDDGTGIVWIRPKPMPTVFALQFGEMLYQLRAALDGAIYQAVVLESGKNPPPDEQSLEFPVCSTPAEYAKKCRFMLKPLSKDRRAIVEAVQPYMAVSLPPEQLVFSVNRSLGILHEWARKDRHRRLHIIGAWATKADPKLRVPRGVRVTSILSAQAGVLEDKHEIAQFRLDGWARGMKVYAYPNLRLEVAINEAPAPCASNDTFANRMAEIVNAAHSIVSALEESF